MKRYSVIFHPDAEKDIASSFHWGCRVWGDKKAKAWARELYQTIKFHITSHPLSCPLAPESQDLGIEVRQLVTERYRILFIVEKKTATILHVRGPYSGKLEVSELPGK